MRPFLIWATIKCLTLSTVHQAAKVEEPFPSWKIKTLMAYLWIALMLWSTSGRCASDSMKIDWAGFEFHEMFHLCIEFEWIPLPHSNYSLKFNSITLRLKSVLVLFMFIFEKGDYRETVMIWHIISNNSKLLKLTWSRNSLQIFRKQPINQRELPILFTRKYMISL